MKPKISVVVPAYNAGRTIADTLMSVKAQGMRDMEVLVVDDRSKDNTAEISKRYADRVIVNKKNRGPAFTRNVGIRQSKADIIAFIDSDCVAEEGWLRSLYGEITRGEADVVMGNVKIPKSGIVGDSISALGFPGGGSTGFEKMWKVDENGFTDHITSCNLAVRKSVFKKHGMFDESFPLAGGEDSEFSFRISKKGAKIKFCRDAVVYHEPRTGLRSFVKWQFRRGESNIHFKRKVGRVNSFVGLRMWSAKNVITTHWNNPRFPLILSLLLLSLALQTIGGISEALRSGGFGRKGILFFSLSASLVIYLSVFPYNSIFSDETSNLLLGRSILDGIYRHDFLSRAPFLPSLASAMYALGLEAFHVRFFVPLLFTLLSVISVYLLAEAVSGRRTAMYAVLLLLSFPLFWRWTVRFLQDIPLMAFTAFSLYLYYLILKDGGTTRRWMLLGLVCGLGVATKLSFLILPAVFLVHMLVSRRNLITRGFPAAFIIFLAVVSGFLLPPAYMGSESAILGTLAGRVTGEEEFTPLRVINNRSILFLDKFVLFPAGIFALLAIIPFWRRDKLMITFSILLFAAYFLLWGIRPRYFSPTFPVLLILTAEGFLRSGGKARKISAAIFAVLIFFSFTNSLQITYMDASSMHGIEDLSASLNDIDGIILSEYMPFYINITKPVPADILPGGAIRDLNNVFTSDDPLPQIKSIRTQYLVLSIYGEYVRSGEVHTFPVFYGPFSLPLDRAYSNGRVPPDYSFGSELYMEIESDAGYERIREIYNSAGTQKLFIIYEVK
jgi:glycosyltransferase involved in cell wall biosynthesis